MIQLLNEHLNKYIPIKEGASFSFSGESQYQDLENYNVVSSFDVELPHSEVLADCFKEYVSGKHYETETGDYWLDIKVVEVETYSYPKVTLIVNGCKLYTGRLVYLSSDTQIIKCAYQAVPYCDAFKNFEFKPTLKDYFYEDTVTRSFMYLYYEPGRQIHICDAKSSYDRITPPFWSYNFHNMNVNPNAPDEKFVSNIFVYDMASDRRTLLDGTYRAYWGSGQIDTFLQCLGIKPQHEIDEFKEHIMTFRANISYKRKIKARYHLSKISDSVNLVYGNLPLDEMWWWDEDNKVWEQLAPEKSIFGGQIVPFGGTIHSFKGLDGMKVIDVQYGESMFGDPVSIPQPAKMTLDSRVMSPMFDLGIDFGMELKNGASFAPVFSGASQLYNNVRPEYVDIIFEYDCKVNCWEDGISRVGQVGMDTPLKTVDLEFLEMSTNEFLNQLSLNNINYRWLRNPNFINKWNHQAIHNQNSFFDLFFITQDKLESVKREFDKDAPSELRLEVKDAFKHTLIKPLNDLGNDPKSVECTMTSLRHVTNAQKENPGGIPMAVFDGKANKFVEQELKGCFGLYKEGANNNASWQSASPDFDYVKDYADKSQKYTFTVTGYQFEEYVMFEGKSFAVGKWSTNDFAKFELECYPNALQW